MLQELPGTAPPQPSPVKGKDVAAASSNMAKAAVEIPSPTGSIQDRTRAAKRIRAQSRTACGQAPVRPTLAITQARG